MASEKMPLTEQTTGDDVPPSDNADATGIGRSHLDVGLLLLRVGIGIVFIVHGWPKLMGGPEAWAKTGQAMSVVGINFAPTFWGFMAGFAEAGGGLLLALGLLVRPAALAMLITMVVAVLRLLDTGAEFSHWSHPLKMAMVFLAILVTGGGRYALGALLPPLRGKLWQ